VETRLLRINIVVTWLRQRAACSVSNLLFILLSMVLFGGLTGPIISFAQNATKIKKHIVAYQDYTNSEMQFIASHFDLVDVCYPGRAVSLSRMNSSITTILYEDMMGMHPTYSDWNEVDTHENWFIHDSFGHRLRRKKHGWYLMDVSSGWKDHIAKRARQHLDDYPVLDGIFADDCWDQLYTNKWFADIENESSVVNAGGQTVTVNYTIYEYGKYGGIEGVWDNTNHTGTNYYTRGSFSGQTITLGTSLTEGTLVFVEYSATDDSFAAPQNKVDSFQNDMSSMLLGIKAQLGTRLLIANAGNLPLSVYFSIIDGAMWEGFLSFYSTDDDVYPSLDTWLSRLAAETNAVQSGVLFLAHSATSGASKNQALIDKKAMFCYASHLLVCDPTYSSFAFVVTGQNVTYYDEWDMVIGEPTGSYYLLEDMCSSGYVIANPSFEDDFNNWEVVRAGADGTPDISNTVIWEGNKSAHFRATTNSGSTIKSRFIPVQPNKYYRLRAAFKGVDIVGGNNPTWKLVALGGFYDADYNGISSFDLSFSEGKGLGTFDWQILYSLKQSPANAVYYCIYDAGLYPTATGEGWIDDIRIAESDPPSEYIIYARNFTNGLVLVNMGMDSHTLELEKSYFTVDGNLVKQVTLAGHESAILISGNGPISGSTMAPSNLHMKK